MRSSTRTSVDPMRCVFHTRIPGNADARELLPLSALREVDPAAHRRAIAKYEDTPERRRLPSTAIPGTGVTWEDVVFLSPVHPRAIWEAWRLHGGVELPSQEFWAIPVGELDGAVVLDRTLTRTGDPIDPSEVTALDAIGYRALDRTTERNAQWIEELTREHRRGAWFHGTPQILVPGAVSLRRAQVIDWAEPRSAAPDHP